MFKNENINIEQQTGKNPEATPAWSEWGSRRFSHMRVLQSAGLLGVENREWRNVAEHSLVANATAMFLAKKINANKENKINEEIVDQASLLHDSTKRLEKEAGYSYATEHDSSIRRDFLEEHGYPDEVIEASEHVGRVPEMFITDDEQREAAIAAMPLEELIVAYADARIRNTDIVTLEEARDLNKKKVPADSEIYDMWYDYYKGVENRIFGLIDEDTAPESVTNQSVISMVKDARAHTP